MVKKIKISKREFYSTRFTVVVLSEKPLAQVELADVAYMITEGDSSGSVHQSSSRVLAAPQAAKALMRQGSDPGFFGLTEKGEDADG